jgi:NAD+ kinase
MAEPSTRRIKVASASPNQTVYNYAVNTANLRAAIDRAVTDHADVLTTPELSITGYAADDYHQWNKDNGDVWSSLTYLANYAYEKDPELTFFVGAPWHYADKSKPAIDPEYNINDRPFNCYFMIKGGRVQSVWAKSILADGPAEYEPRQFNDWPVSKGTIDLSLPDGRRVPFGKPVVFMGDEENGYISVTTEICAEGWPGIHDDLSVNVREQREARHIVALARVNDLSIVLNPSASKPQPAINKEKIRSEGLCKSGSRYCGLYVYTNILGSDSGTYAAEGSQIFAQNGEIIHHGERYSSKDVSYSSVTVDLPVVTRGKPDVAVEVAFKDYPALEKTGGEAAFDLAYARGTIGDDELKYEEYIHSLALWARDYLSKLDAGFQGAIISLSGGKDSADGALIVTTMIDLDVKENGVEGFFKRFKGLKYKDEVIEIYKTRGEAAAVRAIKDRFLTCIYMPSDNSSERTERAARFLIEGGELPDGSHVEGIGGEFYVAPVQAILDEAIIAAVGLDVSKVAADHVDDILGHLEKHEKLDPQERADLARAKLMRQIKEYINAKPGEIPVLPGYVAKNCVHVLPTWGNPADDLTLQNIQSRVRVSIPWTIGNKLNKIPFTTSNASEGALGYTNPGGDLHLGGSNITGGEPKDDIVCSLHYAEKHGFVSLAAACSLYWVNAEKPSAELRKTAEGQVEQSDEQDLGFNYAQSAFIEDKLLIERKTPSEVFQLMKTSKLFSSRTTSDLRNVITDFCKRWKSAQFKRIMSPHSPHVGRNLDPHQSIRTTLLGDHFDTGCARVTLDTLAELAGGDGAFRQKYSYTVEEAKTAAQFNQAFKAALIKKSLPELSDPQTWTPFEEENREALRYAKSSPSAAPAFLSKPDAPFYFMAAETDAAQQALAELTQQYGQASVPEKAGEAIIALGGDGTTLAAARYGIKSRTPVFGINFGHVGFLQNLHKVGEDLLRRIRAAETIEISPLHVKAFLANGDIKADFAINEVHICNQNRGEAVYLRVIVDGKERIDRLGGDGLIISTTVGSSAYSKSARGPALPLGDDLVVLTPNNPSTPVGIRSNVIRPCPIEIEVIDPLFRKVDVWGDSHIVGETAKSIKIVLDTQNPCRLLFDPGYSLHEHVMRSQFLTPKLEG